LVMRKGWAVPAALVGLIAVIIQFFNAFVLQDGIATVGAGAVVLPAVIIILAAVMWWLARKWRGEGWLS
jgi:membrane protein YdbS with pleckstrin-like domain